MQEWSWEVQVETRKTKEEVSVSEEEVPICINLFMGFIFVVAGISFV
jgi:hypothetical protein